MHYVELKSILLVAGARAYLSVAVGRSLGKLVSVTTPYKGFLRSRPNPED